jgi:hypothetical protein
VRHRTRGICSPLLWRMQLMIWILLVDVPVGEPVL